MPLDKLFDNLIWLMICAVFLMIAVTICIFLFSLCWIIISPIIY